MTVSENALALKEWAVLDAAIATGVQSLLLRKGGLHEPVGGFAIPQRGFWLFPTGFHQDSTQLADDAKSVLENVTRPTGSQIPIQTYLQVTDEIQLQQESILPLLHGLHIYGESMLRERFHYRKAGLKLLIVRAYRLSEPHVVDERPEFAGCRSWLTLPYELATAALEPVLTAEEFAKVRNQILRRVTSTANA